MTDECITKNEGAHVRESARRAPIAVIDSGVGGISVLRELVRVMPNESYIFFGDESNAPYGTKTREAVRSITESNVDFLINKYHIKELVIACNTATGAAAKSLRELYPEMPIIGIEPEIKSACSLPGTPKVLIMATPLTLRQPKFRDLLARYGDGAEVTLLPCPGLMELIEEGHTDGELLCGYLRSLFASMNSPCTDFDAVVLGCTHYPHAEKAIARFFPGARFYDGCRGTAAEAARRLEAAGLCTDTHAQGGIEYITTSDNPGFRDICERLLLA